MRGIGFKHCAQETLPVPHCTEQGLNSLGWSLWGRLTLCHLTHLSSLLLFCTLYLTLLIGTFLQRRTHTQRRRKAWGSSWHGSLFHSVAFAEKALQAAERDQEGRKRKASVSFSPLISFCCPTTHLYAHLSPSSHSLFYLYRSPLISCLTSRKRQALAHLPSFPLTLPHSKRHEEGEKEEDIPLYLSLLFEDDEGRKEKENEKKKTSPLSSCPYIAEEGKVENMAAAPGLPGWADCTLKKKQTDRQAGRLGRRTGH